MPPAADCRDQVRGLEGPEVLRDGLACHVEVAAQVTERLSVMAIQKIEESAAAGIGRRAQRIGPCSRQGFGTAYALLTSLHGHSRGGFICSDELSQDSDG